MPSRSQNLRESVQRARDHEVDRAVHCDDGRKVEPMRALHSTLFAIVVGAAAIAPSACVPTEVQVQGSVAPRLVMVDPGVWIVENSPYAVYYSDGYYWQYSGGLWYRSPYYDSGFARVEIGFVPRLVVGGYRPAHVRYRAPSHAHVRPIDRDHRTPRRPHRR